MGTLDLSINAGHGVTDALGNAVTIPVGTLATYVIDNIEPLIAGTAGAVVTASNASAYSITGTCTSNADDITVTLTGASPVSQTLDCGQTIGGGAASAVGTFTINNWDISGWYADPLLPVGTVTLDIVEDPGTGLTATNTMTLVRGAVVTTPTGGGGIAASAPTLTITLSDVSLTAGETSVVTFTF